MVQDILAWSKTILASTPIRWGYLLETYPQELLLLAPAPNEWSAYQCLQHLVEVERLSTPIRLKTFLAGGSFPAFNPDDKTPKDALTLELAAEFGRLRQVTLDILDGLTADDLQKEAHHAEYGVVTLSQFLHHLTAHDLMHTVQAEQAMMQPLIKGLGKWSVNYTAHTHI